MENTSVTLDETEVIMQRYRIRRAGRGKTIEVTVPYNVFEREMRRLGVNPNEAEDDLDAVWRFNSFHGLHLSFEPKEET